MSLINTIKVVLWPMRDEIKKCMYLFSALMGKRFYIKRGSNAETIRVGDAYGSYEIVPAAFQNTPPVVLSFGIGEDCSFEQQLIDQYDAMVYAFDPTPRAIDYIGKARFRRDRLFFYSFGVESFTGPAQFEIFDAGNEEPSGNVIYEDMLLKRDITIDVMMKRYADIIEMLAVTSVDIVKMDIEGSEFAVIEDMLSCPVLPRQICMEFHERFFADGKRKMQKAINRLNQAGYKACSISPNGYEVTFVRS